MSGSPIGLAIELADEERSGAARTRALAAAKALGAGGVAFAAGDDDATRATIDAAKGAGLAVTLQVAGGALAGKCPNDPDARTAAAARAGDAATKHAPAAIELVGFGFPESRAALDGALRFLDALCGCAGCARRGAARKLDVAKLAAKGRKLVEAAGGASATKGAPPLERPEEIGPWLVRQLGAGEAAVLLSVRRESLVAQVQDVRRRLPPGVALRSVAHPSPFVGGRALGGGLVALADLLDGFTLDGPADLATADAKSLAAAVKSARTAAQPSSAFTLRLALPGPEGRDATKSLLRAAIGEGLAAVRFAGTSRWSDTDLAELRAVAAAKR